jgi:hypothetical protein
MLRPRYFNTLWVVDFLLDLSLLVLVVLSLVKLGKVELPLVVAVGLVKRANSLDTLVAMVCLLGVLLEARQPLLLMVRVVAVVVVVCLVLDSLELFFQVLVAVLVVLAVLAAAAVAVVEAHLLAALAVLAVLAVLVRFLFTTKEKTKWLILQ